VSQTNKNNLKLLPLLLMVLVRINPQSMCGTVITTDEIDVTPSQI
jgi:hypothetical protein